jgi:hypothetical protein
VHLNDSIHPPNDEAGQISGARGHGLSDGAGVLVLTDGQHHARATIQTDRISLHINGWYGGTNAGWWEWEHNYRKGKVLKKGDRMRSLVAIFVLLTSLGGRVLYPLLVKSGTDSELNGRDHRAARKCDS